MRSPFCLGQISQLLTSHVLVASFVSFRTNQYKLHYYETPTNIKFVMLTDLKSPSMRIALEQIYINLYVEYVVKNPLSPVEHSGGVGVNNELFEESLEQFVVSGLACSSVVCHF